MWPISEAEKHRVWEWRRRRRWWWSGRARRGSTLFHRESLWPSTESERDERKKWAGYNIMNIMTNKRTFQSFVVVLLWPPHSAQWLDIQPLKGQDVFPYNQVYVLKTPDNNYLWPTPSLYLSLKKLKCIISSFLHLKYLFKLVLIINAVWAHHSITLSSLSRFKITNTFITLYFNK